MQTNLVTSVHYNGEVIERLKNTKTITSLFKNIISIEIVTMIVDFTNKRIALFNTNGIQNAEYQQKS